MWRLEISITDNMQMMSLEFGYSIIFSILVKDRDRRIWKHKKVLWAFPHIPPMISSLLPKVEYQHTRRDGEALLRRKIGNFLSQENLFMISPNKHPSSILGRAVSKSPAFSGVLNKYFSYTSRGHSHIQIMLNQN